MGKFSTVNNVVVVVVDALRADRVGVYGSDRELTPTIDEIAQTGTVFEEAFACINTTDPSITSLHNGRLPRSTVIHHGGLVTDEEKRQIEAADYVPEILSEEGVQTVATGRVLGRWHDRGFEDYAWSSVGETEVRVSRLLQRIHPLLHRVVAGGYNAVADLVKKRTPDSDAVSKLLDATGEDPFYGFVHLMDTHAWYDADETLVDRLLETNDYPDGDLQTFFDDYPHSPVVTKLLEPNATRADHERGLARLFARYDATVVEADRKLRRIVDALKDRGDWDDTALFVLSDHGESLSEHGIQFDHHGLYDQSVRVPLVAHVPGTPPARVNDFVQLHDLAPTIVDLFGVGRLDDVDGRSLLGYFSEAHPPPPSRDAVVIEEAHTQRYRGIRTHRYKLLEHISDKTVAEFWDTDSYECGYCRRIHGDEVELYDLDCDPDETRNVASEHEETVAELREMLNERLDGIAPVDPGDESISYEDESEIMDRLEDLGYG